MDLWINGPQLCWMGDENGIHPANSLCQLFLKVLFQNHWRKKIFVCIFVWKTTCLNFTNFLYMLPVAMAWSSCDRSSCVIYFRLYGWRPVFLQWAIWQYQCDVMLQQVVINFQCICQGCRTVWLCGCIQWQQLVHWGQSLLSASALL